LTAYLAYYEIGNFLLNTKRIDLAKDFLKVMRKYKIPIVSDDDDLISKGAI
jgi:ABC-type uncharacterized transport system substrate-binding protein